MLLFGAEKKNNKNLNFDLLRLSRKQSYARGRKETKEPEEVKMILRKNHSSSRSPKEHQKDLRQQKLAVLQKLSSSNCGSWLALFLYCLAEKGRLPYKPALQYK